MGDSESGSSRARGQEEQPVLKKLLGPHTLPAEADNVKAVVHVEARGLGVQDGDSRWVLKQDSGQGQLPAAAGSALQVVPMTSGSSGHGSHTMQKRAGGGAPQPTHSNSSSEPNALRESRPDLSSGFQSLHPLPQNSSSRPQGPLVAPSTSGSAVQYAQWQTLKSSSAPHGLVLPQPSSSSAMYARSERSSSARHAPAADPASSSAAHERHIRPSKPSSGPHGPVASLAPQSISSSAAYHDFLARSSKSSNPLQGYHAPQSNSSGTAHGMRTPASTSTTPIIGPPAIPSNSSNSTQGRRASHTNSSAGVRHLLGTQSLPSSDQLFLHSVPSNSSNTQLQYSSMRPQTEHQHNSHSTSSNLATVSGSSVPTIPTSRTNFLEFMLFTQAALAMAGSAPTSPTAESASHSQLGLLMRATDGQVKPLGVASSAHAASQQAGNEISMLQENGVHADTISSPNTSSQVSDFISTLQSSADDRAISLGPSTFSIHALPMLPTIYSAGENVTGSTTRHSIMSASDERASGDAYVRKVPHSQPATNTFNTTISSGSGVARPLLSLRAAALPLQPHAAQLPLLQLTPTVPATAATSLGSTTPFVKQGVQPYVSTSISAAAVVATASIPTAAKTPSVSDVATAVTAAKPAAATADAYNKISSDGPDSSSGRGNLPYTHSPPIPPLGGVGKPPPHVTRPSSTPQDHRSSSHSLGSSSGTRTSQKVLDARNLSMPTSEQSGRHAQSSSRTPTAATAGQQPAVPAANPPAQTKKRVRRWFMLACLAPKVREDDEAPAAVSHAESAVSSRQTSHEPQQPIAAVSKQRTIEGRVRVHLDTQPSMDSDWDVMGGEVNTTNFTVLSGQATMRSQKSGDSDLIKEMAKAVGEPTTTGDFDAGPQLPYDARLERGVTRISEEPTSVTSQLPSRRDSLFKGGDVAGKVLGLQNQIMALTAEQLTNPGAYLSHTSLSSATAPVSASANVVASAAVPNGHSGSSMSQYPSLVTRTHTSTSVPQVADMFQRTSSLFASGMTPDTLQTMGLPSMGFTHETWPTVLLDGCPSSASHALFPTQTASSLTHIEDTFGSGYLASLPSRYPGPQVPAPPPMPSAKASRFSVGMALSQFQQGLELPVPSPYNSNARVIGPGILSDIAVVSVSGTVQPSGAIQNVFSGNVIPYPGVQDLHAPSVVAEQTGSAHQLSNSSSKWDVAVAPYGPRTVSGRLFSPDRNHDARFAQNSGSLAQGPSTRSTTRSTVRSTGLLTSIPDATTLSAGPSNNSGAGGMAGAQHPGLTNSAMVNAVNTAIQDVVGVRMSSSSGHFQGRISNPASGIDASVANASSASHTFSGTVSSGAPMQLELAAQYNNVAVVPGNTMVPSAVRTLLDANTSGAEGPLSSAPLSTAVRSHMQPGIDPHINDQLTGQVLVAPQNIIQSAIEHNSGSHVSQGGGYILKPEEGLPIVLGPPGQPGDCSTAGMNPNLDFNLPNERLHFRRAPRQVSSMGHLNAPGLPGMRRSSDAGVSGLAYSSLGLSSLFLPKAMSEGITNTHVAEYGRTLAMPEGSAHAETANHGNVQSEVAVDGNTHGAMPMHNGLPTSNQDAASVQDVYGSALPVVQHPSSLASSKPAVLLHHEQMVNELMQQVLAESPGHELVIDVDGQVSSSFAGYVVQDLSPGTAHHRVSARSIEQLDVVPEYVQHQNSGHQQQAVPGNNPDGIPGQNETNILGQVPTFNAPPNQTYIPVHHDRQLPNQLPSQASDPVTAQAFGQFPNALPAHVLGHLPAGLPGQVQSMMFPHAQQGTLVHTPWGVTPEPAVSIAQGPQPGVLLPSNLSGQHMQAMSLGHRQGSVEQRPQGDANSAPGQHSVVLSQGVLTSGFSVQGHLTGVVPAQAPGLHTSGTYAMAAPPSIAPQQMGAHGIHSLLDVHGQYGHASLHMVGGVTGHALSEQQQYVLCDANGRPVSQMLSAGAISNSKLGFRPVRVMDGVIVPPGGWTARELFLLAMVVVVCAFNVGIVLFLLLTLQSILQGLTPAASVRNEL